MVEVRVSVGVDLRERQAVEHVADPAVGERVLEQGAALLRPRVRSIDRPRVGGAWVRGVMMMFLLQGFAKLAFP